MGKFLVLVAAGLALAGFIHFRGDALAIPEDFLALEEKRCVENTRGLSRETTARYCTCTRDGIAASFSFKDYVLVASDMAETLGADDLKAEAGRRLDEIGALCRRNIDR
jgi:hypothetical protein